MTLSELITELRFQLGGRQDITDAMLINYIYWTQRRLDVLVPLRQLREFSQSLAFYIVFRTVLFHFLLIPAYLFNFLNPNLLFREQKKPSSLYIRKTRIY